MLYSSNGNTRSGEILSLAIRQRVTLPERDASLPFVVVPKFHPSVYDDPDFMLTITIETRNPATGKPRGMVSRHTGPPRGKSQRWACGMLAPTPGLLSTITLECTKPVPFSVDLEELEQPAPRPSLPDHHSIAFDEFDYAETASSATSVDVTGVVHDAGDLLVALASVYNTAGSTMTVTGSINSTYTNATGSPVMADANGGAHIQYKQNATGGTETVTFDPTGTSSDIDAVVCEVSGASTSSAFDQYVEATGHIDAGSSGTATVTTGTLAQANNIVFAVMTHTGATARVLTSDAAFTFIAEDEDNSTSQAMHSEYKLVTATTAVTATVGISVEFVSACDWAIAAAVFKEAAAGGATVSTLALLGVGKTT